MMREVFFMAFHGSGAKIETKMLIELIIAGLAFIILGLAIWYGIRGILSSGG